MALIERSQKNVDATNWPGQIPMRYIYTAGRGGELFFSALRDKGEFVGAKCEACGIVLLPPQMYCERCFSNIEGNTVKVPNLGSLEAFTICHEDYDETPKEEPTLVVRIQMEGTEGGIFHWLKGVDPEDLLIGMPVKAKFKPKKDRVGSLLDIAYFEPA
ncbi:MAG: Zn-ribbon domain-containing OB-fold protein [Planctomycetota bacterium]|jgi:uncharacterized OB-fold protein